MKIGRNNKGAKTSELEARGKTSPGPVDGEKSTGMMTSTIDTGPSAVQRAASSFARCWRAYLVMFLLWVIGSLLIIVRPSFAPESYSKELLRQNVNRAEFRFEYQDQKEVEDREAKAAEAVAPVYVLNESENGEHERKANVEALEDNYRRYTSSLDEDVSNDLTQKRTLEQLKKYVESASLDGIVAAEDKNEYENKIIFVYRLHGKDDNIDELVQERRLLGEFKTPEEMRESVVKKVSELFKLSEELTQVLENEIYTIDVFQPTLIYDSARYNALVEKEKKIAHSQVTKHYLEVGDELFTYKTRLLSDKDLERYYSELRKYNTGRLMTKLPHLLRNCREIMHIILLAIFIGCYGVCVFKTKNRIASQMRTLSLAAAVQFLYFLLFYALSLVMYRFKYEELSLMLCFLPIVVPASIIANLLGARQAVLAALFVSLSAPLFINLGLYEYQLVHFSLITNAVAISSFIKASKRSDFGKAGFWLGTFVMLSSLFFALEQGESEWYRYISKNMPLYAYINGISVSFLVYVSLLLFEKLFGLVTPTTLLETSDVRNPLLSRLKIYAPGTYQHCLNVSTIAQEAAQAIGANAELARVMALFHDVGKLNNPQFFAENIPAGQPNPHETISPLESAAIIRQHVTAGLPIAVKYHVPRPVRPVIEQHHGNSLIGNFYYKAKAQAEAEGQPVPDETLFRYPSELPSRKEIVIVSLADSCEAAVKSLFNKQIDVKSLMNECIAIIKEQSENGLVNDKDLADVCAQAFKKTHPEQPHEAIKPMIDMIFDARWRDGQLAEAELTLHELQLVRESFYKTFADVYHFRPQYNTSKQENTK